ncbi:11733_t:CDS:2, partial [Dentiscutata heterogama]
MAANRSNQVQNQGEDSPTDTTNPAIPDDSPTIPPDNNVSEDPLLSISPNNAGPSSITSPTTTPPSHTNSYNSSSPANRVVNSQQTSSSNQPNQR